MKTGTEKETEIVEVVNDIKEEPWTIRTGDLKARHYPQRLHTVKV